MTSLDVFETVGPTTDSERLVENVYLAASDVSSAVPSFMRRNANGAPVYSCERWLRLRFSPPSTGIITAVRFWVPNYQPNDGWTVRFGLSSGYRAPVRARSDYARTVLPTVDPGADTPNLITEPFTVTQIVFSDYLVLQATVTVDHAGPIQETPLSLKLAWSET